MRAIEFRAFNRHTKTMVDLKAITPLAVSVDQDGLFIPFNDEWPLMQFTGLVGRDGVKIFESDRIFHHKYQKEFVVTWNQDGCGWNLGDMALSKLCIPNLEVVGNIYETEAK